jgi:hypothetical protein
VAEPSPPPGRRISPLFMVLLIVVGVALGFVLFVVVSSLLT